MKKKFGIGLMCMSLLLGGCGNAEESVALGENINMQESETVEESETFVDEVILEQDSEEPGTEEPEIEELETAEITTEEPETEEPTVTTEPMPEEPTYISREFLDFLEGYVMENKGVDALEGMACGQELSKEDMLDYQSDPAVAEYIERGTFTKVDGDNDGIDDFYVRLPGGSMGNDFWCFLQGQEDGSFQETCWTDSHLGNWSFIRYGETNYLLQNFYYYEPYGFAVTLYQDGEVLETLSVKKEMSYYEPNVRHLSEGYEEIAEEFLEKGSGGWKDGSHKLGTAEKKVSTGSAGYPTYGADLDNDGEQERYYKTVWWRDGNLYTQLETRKGTADIWETYGIKYEGVLDKFWVDSIGDKNIVFLICKEARRRKILYGYLIEGDETTTVMDIDFVGVPTIEYCIYTKGINYTRDPWSIKG